MCKAELDSARTYVDDLKFKYANPLIGVDQTENQCSRCHLREGHKRSNCVYGDCQGPENCKDIDRHPAVINKVFCTHCCSLTYVYFVKVVMLLLCCYFLCTIVFGCMRMKI